MMTLEQAASAELVARNQGRVRLLAILVRPVLVAAYGREAGKTNEAGRAKRRELLAGLLGLDEQGDWRTGELAASQVNEVCDRLEATEQQIRNAGA